MYFYGSQNCWELLAVAHLQSHRFEPTRLRLSLHVKRVCLCAPCGRTLVIVLAERPGSALGGVRLR